MKKHTPGPWSLSVDNDGVFQVGAVCDVWSGEVDARLITAAPELLVALEQISHAEAATYDDIHAAIQDLVGIARAAIVKAT